MKKCHPVLLIATVATLCVGVLCIPHGCAWAKNLYQDHRSPAAICVLPSPTELDQCWISF